MRRGPQTNIISTARLRDEPKAWLPKPLGFIIAGVLALVTTAIFCSAQQRTGKSIETPSVSVAISPEAQIVPTQHQVKVGQRIRKYTANAGLLPIKNNETGESHRNMFFVAYLLDRAPNEPKRPLMFLWNGGPGANSTLVHLSGFGPIRIKSNDDPTGSTGCECEL